MSKYLDNVKEYVDSPNEDAVASIEGHLGVTLESRDAELVAATDASELEAIKNGFCKKNLDLSDEAADKAIAEVCDKMKGDNAKCRVTFYYLLAEVSGSMDRVVG